MSFAHLFCYGPKAVPHVFPSTSKYNQIIIFSNRGVHTEHTGHLLLFLTWNEATNPAENVHSLGGDRVSGAMMRPAISQADMSMKLDLIHFSFICEPSIISSHQSKVGCIPETVIFLNAHALIINTQKHSFLTA